MKNPPDVRVWVVLTTGRSEVATPAFMPVGSLGNVRSVDGEELLKMGYGLILNNAYHLLLASRP